MGKKNNIVVFISLAFLCCLAIVPFISPKGTIAKHPDHHDLFSYFKQSYECKEPAEQTDAGNLTAEVVFPENVNRELIVAATGDIMIHSPQIVSAYQENDNRYDFWENFFYVVPYFKMADFVVGNLETTLTGKEYGGYSGYPLFNSPPELADVLKKSGFDLLTTANNHSLDRGPVGIINTINNLEEAGLGFIGTARNAEERRKGYLFSGNGIKAAFLAYTYGTNGLPVPPGMDYLINLIDEQLIGEDIFRAKNIYGADIVFICIHWGNEYQRVPSDQQRELAEMLINSGADIIIGNHPHVIQPAEIIKTEKGTGLVFYSLGNFISNQRDRYCDTGMVAFIKIQFEPVARTYCISLLDIEPTWVHKFMEGGKWKYRILPVHEILNTEQAQEIFNLSPENYRRIAEAFQETEEIYPCPVEMIFCK